MADTESLRLSLDLGQTLHRAGSVSTAPGEAPAPLPQGDARYEHIGILGEGGMGRVVEAVDRQFSRVVAIKELKGSGGDSGQLHTEALVTGNLEHPGVPAVYERGHRADGSPFYVMRRVRGRALEDALSEAKDLSARLTQLPALTRAAQTLGFAHEKGVVHRDVKPQNIMVGTHGEVFVVDWGLARVGNLSSSSGSSDGASASSPQKTMQGAVMGTPAYMAPEQARGDTSMIDARTDVFALGAVLYRILAGKPPYDGANTSEVLALAARGEFPSIDVVAPDAPFPLREICKKAMAVAPEQRFQTAQHLAEELTRFAFSAVKIAYEKGAGSASHGAVIFGIITSLFGLAGVVRLSPWELFLGAHLLIGGVFFVISVALAYFEGRSRGKLGLMPIGFSLTACVMLTGFIGVGFAILTHVSTDPVLAAKQAAVALATNGLLTAASLAAWGLVLFRRR